MREPITFHTEIVNRETDERRVTIRHFPRETAFDFFLLGLSDRAMLHVEDPTITLTVANGKATYRLALSETNGVTTEIPAYLISAWVSEPQP